MAALLLPAATWAGAASLGSPQPDPFVVPTGRFELRSAPRVALHHFLLDWALADAGEWPGYALPIPVRETWRETVSPADQRIWSEAVGAYGSARDRSLLFDPGMLAVRDWAAGAAPRDRIPQADRDLADAIDRAMPVYRRYWWASHDQRNRAWIESLAPTLRRVENEMIARFEAAYGGSWPQGLVPVDVMVYANAVGAYSTGGRLTISSAEGGLQMPQALEMVFHEASHMDALEGPLREALDEGFASAGLEQPERFWHDVIFFTSGEITRLVLAEQGDPGYRHYGSFGLYRRGERWTRNLPALEEHWGPFLAGRSSSSGDRRNALAAVARAVAGRPEGESPGASAAPVPRPVSPPRSLRPSPAPRMMLPAPPAASGVPRRG